MKHTTVHTHVHIVCMYMCVCKYVCGVCMYVCMYVCVYICWLSTWLKWRVFHHIKTYSSCYSHLMIFSPNCALHTALAHVINVLGIVESHMPNVISIHVRLHRFNALITWVIAVCNVRSGLEIMKWLYQCEWLVPHVYKHTTQAVTLTIYQLYTCCTHRHLKNGGVLIYCLLCLSPHRSQLT